MIITGNIGQDLQKKTAKSGRDYVTFTMAESWGKDEASRVTNWFSVAFYGKPEMLEGFKKGVRVEVQGDLKVNQKDGKVYLDIMSSRAKLAPLPPKKDAGAGQDAGSTAPASTGSAPAPSKGVPDPHFSQDDDIPF